MSYSLFQSLNILSLYTRVEEKKHEFKFLNNNPYNVDQNTTLNITCVTDAYAFKSARIQADSSSVLVAIGQQPITTEVKGDDIRIVTYFVEYSQPYTGVFWCITVRARTGEEQRLSLNVTVQSEYWYSTFYFLSLTESIRVLGEKTTSDTNTNSQCHLERTVLGDKVSLV